MREQDESEVSSRTPWLIIPALACMVAFVVWFTKGKGRTEGEK